MMNIQRFEGEGETSILLDILPHSFFDKIRDQEDGPLEITGEDDEL